MPAPTPGPNPPSRPHSGVLGAGPGVPDGFGRSAGRVLPSEPPSPAAAPPPPAYLQALISHSSTEKAMATHSSTLA